MCEWSVWIGRTGIPWVLVVVCGVKVGWRDDKGEREKKGLVFWDNEDWERKCEKLMRYTIIQGVASFSCIIIMATKTRKVERIEKDNIRRQKVQWRRMTPDWFAYTWLR